MSADLYHPFKYWRSPRLFYFDAGKKRIYYNCLTNEAVCVSEEEASQLSDDQINTKLTEDNRLIKQWADARDTTALLTIYFTQRCNLRCAYCYAKHDGLTLDPETAITVFRHWYENALRLHCTKLLINFHGSGEPLMEIDNLKRVMDVISSTIGDSELNVVKMLSTNGTLLTTGRLAWVSENFDAVTISDDGPAEISIRYAKRNSARNMRDVIQYANSFLRQNNRICKIQSMISKANIHRAVEIIEYYWNLGVDRIHYAPLLFSGKKEGERFEIRIREFLPVYYEALLEAKRLSVQLVSQVYSPVGGRTAPCGAVGKQLNYVLMPDGRISSCYYDTDSDLDLVFSYGYASSNGVMYYEDKVKHLREMGEGVRPDKCMNCPVVYNCGTSCIYAQRLRQGVYAAGLVDDDCRAVLTFHARILSGMFGG